MLKNGDQIYQSFLVRCWLMPSSTADEPQGWRFELREVTAEPREQRFGDLEQLKDFMAKELAAIAAGNKRGSDRVDGRKGGEP